MPKTGLGRAIVWGVPSNRLAVIGSGVGAIVVALVRFLAGRPVTVGNVFSTFAALFLAWASAREVDPDRPASATVALVFAALAILEFGFASLRLVLGALLAIRMIAGTVGARLQLGDVAVVAALAAYVGYRDAAWVVIAAMATGAAMAGERHRASIGLGVAGVGFAGIAFSQVQTTLSRPDPATWAVLAGVVIATVVLAAGPAPVATTDIGARLLPRRRVVAGRVAAGIIVAIVSLQTGLAAATGPAAAALLGSATVRLVRQVRPKES